jgi:hypothetical protein
MLRMRPVERGVFLPRARVLAVADLHLGYEFELFRSGLRIPSQTERMKGRLTTLIEQVGPKELIVAGDFKHNIPYVGDWEYEELERFARDLALPITVIRGTMTWGSPTLCTPRTLPSGGFAAKPGGRWGSSTATPGPARTFSTAGTLSWGTATPPSS